MTPLALLLIGCLQGAQLVATLALLFVAIPDLIATFHNLHDLPNRKELP